MRLIWSHSILNWLYGEAVSYPTPTSLSFFWSFGVMALVCLISQILSGIFLAMHYIPSAELAFSSVEHIMRDVRGGWFLRYLHANGASMFFLVVYLHISRGIYYNSFADKRQFIWYSGVIILFLMIVTAFLGYVLPWGQMSFWAATVITSLASAIPIVGDAIVAWLWGGFSVGEQTLVRFFSLHYLLPFILFALVAAHIVILHETGSSTPTGVALQWGDRITFGPYFFLKDLYYLVLFFMLFMYFVFFNPNYLGHPDNYIAAMYMSTPAHIVPEWYFLPFYALLRSVPNKLGGVIVMLVSILSLALLPLLFNKSNKIYRLTSNFYPERAVFFSLFIGNSILLGWIGGQPIEEPMYTVGQYSSIFYFVLIFVIFPYINTNFQLWEFGKHTFSTPTLSFVSMFTNGFCDLFESFVISPKKKFEKKKDMYEFALFQQGEHWAFHSQLPDFEPTRAKFNFYTREEPTRITDELDAFQIRLVLDKRLQMIDYLLEHKYKVDKKDFDKYASYFTAEAIAAWRDTIFDTQKNIYQEIEDWSQTQLPEWERFGIGCDINQIMQTMKKEEQIKLTKQFKIEKFKSKFDEFLKEDVDSILFDNMSKEELKNLVLEIKHKPRSVYTWILFSNINQSSEIGILFKKIQDEFNGNFDTTIVTKEENEKKLIKFLKSFLENK